MHNLHLVRLKADSHSDAISIVEDSLLNWGTENNYFSVLGSLCKEDSTFSEDYKNTYFSKEDILYENYLGDSILYLNKRYKEAFDFALVAENENEVDWYRVSKFSRHMREVVGLKDINKIDIWSDVFYEYSYDELGITELLSDGEFTYIVFIDMHS